MPVSVNERNRRAAQSLDETSSAADVGDILKPGGGSSASSSGAGFPFDVSAPPLRVTGSIDATVARIVIRHICGSRIRLQVDGAGSPSLIVTNCSGDGQQLTPDGIKKVHIDPTDEGEPEPDASSEPTLAPMAVEACVDGVTRTIHLMGSA